MTYAPPTEVKRLITEVYQLEELYGGSNLRRQHKIHYLTLSEPTQDGLPTNIEIELNNSYPFTAPIVYYVHADGHKEKYINTIHYCHMPRITRYMKEYIYDAQNKSVCTVDGTPIARTPNEQIKNINLIKDECFHCSFVLNDWSPAMRIIHVIHEIHRINYLKRNIKYKISLERIKCIPEELIPHIISFIDPIGR